MAVSRARQSWLLSVWLGIALTGAYQAASLRAQAPAPQAPAPAALSDAEIEAFLLKADVVKTKSTSKGITGSLQATLSDGTITHDAHIQNIDESKREFQSMRGTEFNFRDSWTFNVAGYKLDRLLGLNMVPVSVSRRYRSKPSAFTWWVDNVAMDEGDRLKKKITPPDYKTWNQQMQLVRLFDQLIYNVDRNMGNLLITRDWHVWAIDHTRAFRTHDQLKSPENVSRCDRQVFQRLKDLDNDTLKRELGSYLDNWQIRALLARRDAIVKRIESLGPAALFDREAPGTDAP
ncbi:MAG: hypothetical protein WBC51_03995 [Vicinamibacterales bacterium]